MKIIKGDKVKVLLGKDKGRTGEVLASFPKKNSVIVKDINKFKKHLKSTKEQKGGIIEKERAIMVSKIALI
jgi:large subunit ribosomal protein L24